MIKSCVIVVEEKSKKNAEEKLGVKFNEWCNEHPLAKIVHFFEPVRFDKTYGDYTYNTYHTIMTFFYNESLPCGLKELE